MGESSMNYSTLYDQEYYQAKVIIETNIQPYMDVWYRDHGFKITNRKGNFERDLVLVDKQNKPLDVEEKYRSKDWGDLLVELTQDMVKNSPGWFYTEKPDILSYIIHNNIHPAIIYWIWFEKFRDWMFKYLASVGQANIVISPKGIGLTLNIAIPWKLIPEGIYSKHVFINY